MKTLLSLILAFSFSAFAQEYPADWFKPVPTEGAPAWEILPQAAGPGEVILSKRNELGILSNFAATPFEYRGVKYASVEGFWQMMKYPESETDPRATLTFPFTRSQVSNMIAFEAKNAGSIGEKMMEQLGIDWVTFEGQQMVYCSVEKGLHFQLIKEAMIEKLNQNSEVKRILKLTGNLILKPDHHAEGCQAPEWKYYELWMEIRSEMI